MEDHFPELCSTQEGIKRLPTVAELKNNGFNSLYSAIQREMRGQGGYREFIKGLAADLNVLPPPEKANWQGPQKDWRPAIDHYVGFIRKNPHLCTTTGEGITYLPNLTVLKQNGLSGFVEALERKGTGFPGGYSGFAGQLAPTLEALPPPEKKTDWRGPQKDWKPAKDRLEQFMEEHPALCTTPDGRPRLPTGTELTTHGLAGLYATLNNKMGYPGGYNKFSDDLAKTLKVQPPSARTNWRGEKGDWQPAEEHFKQFLQEHPTVCTTPDGRPRLPTPKELKINSPGSGNGLYQALFRHYPGGYRAFVDQLAVKLKVLPRDDSNEIKEKNLREVLELGGELSQLVEVGILSPGLRMLALLKAGELRDLEEADLRMALTTTSDSSKQNAEGPEAIDTQTADILDEIPDPAILSRPHTGEETVDWAELDDDVSQSARERLFLAALQQAESLGVSADDTLLLQLKQDLWKLFLPKLAHCEMGVGILSSDAQEVLLGLEELHPELFASVGDIHDGLVARGLAEFASSVAETVVFKERLDASPNWPGVEGGQTPRIHQLDAGCRQAEAIEAGGFILNAQDPGVGKTVSVLMAIAASSVKRVLVVAPKSVADQTWVSSPEKLGEVEKWLPNSTVHRGAEACLRSLQSPVQDDRVQFYVLHYEELDEQRKSETVEALAAFAKQFDVAVLDEIQRVKQRQGMGANLARQALEKILPGTKSCIGLAGTPLSNELREPLSLLGLLSRGRTRDPETFSPEVLRDRRVQHRAQVYSVLLKHLVRHRFEDVMGHIPAPKVHTVPVQVPVEMEEELARLYALPATQNANKVVEMAKLLTRAKLEYIREKVQQIPGKVLVLSSLVQGVSLSVMEDLQKSLGSDAVVFVDGTVKDSDRQQALAEFRRPGGAKVLMTTYDTAGVGITPFDPTAPPEDIAHHVIAAHLPYTYAQLLQGLARLYREGQPNHVQVHIPIATTSRVLDGQEEPPKTLDEILLDLITGKRRLSEVSIDGSLDDADIDVRRAIGSWLASSGA